MHPVPFQSLGGLERVRVNPEMAARIDFECDDSVFELVNEDGDRVVYAGTHKLLFTNDNMKEPIVFTK